MFLRVTLLKEGFSEDWSLALNWACTYMPLKIITNRLSAYCEANDILPEAQCVFRPGRSTVCMLFVMRRLQELARRRKMPL